MFVITIHSTLTVLDTYSPILMSNIIIWIYFEDSVNFENHIGKY